MTVARSFLICNDDALATITLHRAHVATPDPHQRSPRDVPVRRQDRRRRTRRQAGSYRPGQSMTARGAECLAEFPLRRPGRTGELLKCSAALAITLLLLEYPLFQQESFAQPDQLTSYTERIDDPK